MTRRLLAAAVYGLQMGLTASAFAALVFACAWIFDKRMYG